MGTTQTMFHRWAARYSGVSAGGGLVSGKLKGLLGLKVRNQG